MPTNLRARVEEFNPFRRQEPSSVGATLDTYAAPVVDDSRERELRSMVESLRGISPALNRYADRQFAQEQEALAAQAQGAIADLTPDQIRAESERDWEQISKERGIDNPWWKIRLDEAAGRRIGLEYAERLTGRSTEASNLGDSNAHLRVIEEERARATSGMNDFQRAQFEAVADGVTQKFVLSAATNRAQRFEAETQQQYQDDVRGLVRESLDPALGGDVDLTALRGVVISERGRSGNDGRKEIVDAIKDTITTAAAGADNDAELDAISLQVTALLGQIEDETFGDEKSFGENEATNLDALESLADRAIRARADTLRDRKNQKQDDAREEMDDFSLSLSAQVFDGRLTQQEAEGQMLTKAQEIGKRDGVDTNLLIGAGRVSLRNQVGAVESTRFALIDDPDAVKGLKDLATGPEFQSGWYGVALEGALNAGKITRDTYAFLLEMGTDGNRRAVEKAAAAPVDALTQSMGERLLAAAEPMLDSIVDDAERDAAEARLLAELDKAMTSERGRLSSMIQSHGLEAAAAAVDAWTPDFLGRSGKLIEEITRDVEDQIPGGSMDRSKAFRNRIQAEKAYGPARERWIYEFMRARLDEDSAAQISIPGDTYSEAGPDDVAAYVASGRAGVTSGLAFRMYAQAEESFLLHLETQARVGDPNSPPREALQRAQEMIRNGNFTVPQPEAPPAKRAEDAATAKEKVTAAAGERAQQVGPSAQNLAEAQARTERFRAEGRPEAFIQEAERLEKQIDERFRKDRAIAYSEHQTSLYAVSRGLDPDAVTGFATSSGLTPIGDQHRIQVKGGRVSMKEPPQKSTSRFWFGRMVPDLEKADDMARRIENQFVAAKLWTGLTLEEVQAGKGKPSKDAQPENWINLDRQAISPAAVPFFGSVAELDAADDATIRAWLKEFPGYSRESFLAAQRLVILTRIPEPK